MPFVYRAQGAFTIADQGKLAGSMSRRASGISRKSVLRRGANASPRSASVMTVPWRTPADGFFERQQALESMERKQRYGSPPAPPRHYSATDITSAPFGTFPSHGYLEEKNMRK